MKLNIGVLYGGRSTEHEISIISAVQAMNNLDEEKYNIIPIYLAKDNTMYSGDLLRKIDTYKDLNSLKKNVSEVFFNKRNGENVLIKNHFPYKVYQKVDLILPVLHGYNTEDGNIAGFLETLGIPYCESDIYSSVIGQDKIFQKAVLKASGINVCDYYYFYEMDFKVDEKKIMAQIMQMPFPLIVKPARQGSSVGISIAHDEESLNDAIEEALLYDEKILVEKVVENLKELNISVVGDSNGYMLSEIEEVFSSDEILSYQDKYLSGNTKGAKGMASAGRKIPADISHDIKSKLEDMAYKASKALNINGVVRIDFLLDQKTNILYLNEFNIIPGSLAFYLWPGLPYSGLLDKIISCAIRRYQNKEKKLSSFDTNVLEGFNGSKGVKK